MKVETYIFGINAAFFTVVAPAYWFLTYDWTGTSALFMTMLLALMVTVYLGFHASRMEPRPEDRQDGAATPHRARTARRAARPPPRRTRCGPPG